MATYIPGVQGYFPKFEPFTPDYKFLSGVLDTRTDRYNTNYKDLNDTYSKIVYADLSRTDTQSMRDQYTNKLIPKLEQISGLDLSIQQNADSAKALFKPFYESNLIVRDMVNTQQYKKELNRANDLQNSNDENVKSQYWQEGIEALKYQMDDFINADPNQAVNIGAPKYVPKADLFKLGNAYLEKSGLKVEMDKLDPTGNWIIKEKNGDLIVPAAYEALKNQLLNDPKVINAYQTDAYVKARRYAENGVKSGQFTSVEDGKKKWANSILETVKNKTLTEITTLKKDVDAGQDAVNNWEEYKNTTGIIPGSDDEKKMNESIAYLEAAKQNLKSKEDILQRYTQPGDALNTAYNLLMSSNMDEDLKSSAKTYGMKDASITLKDNPFAMEQLKASDQFAIHSQKISKEKSSSNNNGEENDNSAVIKAFNPNSTGGAETSIYNADSKGNVNANTNVVDLNKSAILMQANKTANTTVDWILQYHQLNESLKTNGDPANITFETKDGIFTGTLDQARVKLTQLGNSNQLNELFKKYKTNLDNAATTNPLMLTNNGGVTYNQLKLSADAVEADMLKNVKAGEMAVNIYYQNFKNVRSTEYGKDLIKQENQGVPMIVTTPLEEKIKNYNPTDAEKIKAFSDWAKANNRNPNIQSEVDWQTAYMLAMQNKQQIASQNETDAKPILLSKEEFINQYLNKGNEGLIKDDKGYVKTWSEKISDEYDFDAPIRTADGYTYAHKKLNSREVMIKDAEEAYNTQLGILNKTLNGTFNLEPTKENLQGSKPNVFKPFTADQFFRGKTLEQMTTGDLVTFPVYAKTIDPYNITDPETKSMLIDFGTQYHNTPNIGIAAGNIKNLTQKDLLGKDPQAEYIIRQMMENVNVALLDPKTPKSSTPTFTMKYAPVYGAADDPTKNAAYIIDFDKDYIKGFLQNTKDEKGIIDIKDLEKYSTITISFPKENDVNAKAYGNYEHSAVETEISNNKDHKLTYTHPNGGSLNVYKNGDTWMYSMEYKKWDPIKLDFVTDNRLTAKPLRYNENGDPVSTGDLDRVVNSLKLGLNDLAVINLKNKATQQKTTFFQQPPGYIYNSQTGKYTQQ